MNYLYKTRGTCSAEIRFAIAEDDTLEGVEFRGGCDGNLQAIAELVKGQKAETIISKLKGIECCSRGTSCPDQLAKALEAYLNRKTD